MCLTQYMIIKNCILGFSEAILYKIDSVADLTILYIVNNQGLYQNYNRNENIYL